MTNSQKRSTDYESDYTIDTPITIHYTAGGTITTEPEDKLVEY